MTYMVKKLTTIAITEEIYEKLRDLGKTGDSFNDVITRLVNAESAKKRAHLAT